MDWVTQTVYVMTSIQHNTVCQDAFKKYSKERLNSMINWSKIEKYGSTTTIVACRSTTH